jgi:hypothetical protein
MREALRFGPVEQGRQAVAGDQYKRHAGAQLDGKIRSRRTQRGQHVRAPFPRARQLAREPPHECKCDRSDGCCERPGHAEADRQHEPDHR